jgi:hypothetical protein
MGHRRLLLSIGLTSVELAKVQKQSLAHHLLNAVVVEVQDIRLSDKAHSLFNKFVVIAMELVKLLEIPACKSFIN